MVRRLSLASLISVWSRLFAVDNRASGGLGAPRLTTTYDMSVIDRHSGRWYVKDIRASTQSMGTQWLRSPHHWSDLVVGGPIANALMSAEGRIVNIRFLCC
jgi:hypothetical protein